MIVSVSMETKSHMSVTWAVEEIRVNSYRTVPSSKVLLLYKNHIHESYILDLSHHNNLTRKETITTVKCLFQNKVQSMLQSE